MSTTDVTSAAVHEKLVDVTTCCICDETYRDPKILPCVHTFCLTCLQRTGTQASKKPGNPMPCPLCRREFTVPQEGFAALQKNFFMEGLVLWRDKLEIATPQQGASSVCDEHEHENLCLYCSDCKEVLCLVCLRESHQNHRLSDLSSTANILHSQLQSDVGTAKHYMYDALKKKERLAQKKIAILGKIEGFETEVWQVRSDLKALIDQHADSILQNLGLLKMKGIKDIEIEERKLEKHLACLKNFEKCCAELTSYDQHDSLICKVASELREQMVELELFNKSAVECPLRSFEINFTKTVPAPLEEFRGKNSGNLIGKVEANIDYSINPELVMTVVTHNVEGAKGDGIRGMTVSNNKVFILNDNSPLVSIYDADTLSYMYCLNIEDYVGDVSLGPCASVDGIVYIVNRISSEILQIDENLVTVKWSTGNDWSELSVTDASTILATCFSEGALRECSLEGTLLREIKLCSCIAFPSSAIKLNNGHFVVSHGDVYDNLNRVCLVNLDGGIVKSFGGSRCSRIKQLDNPTCLAVDEDGNILVLDENNSRVLLLSPALEFKRELLTKENGLRSPVAMHLDKKTSRLYIADNKCMDCKLFVFNLK